MNYSDWFEDLMSIAVLVSIGNRNRNPEPEVTVRLNNLIKFLEDTNAKDEDGNLIIEKARKDYLSNIQSRAIHHFERSKELKQKIDTTRESNPLNEKLPEWARDFHHEAYYAIFYCARHLLVSNKQLDTNIHEKIPEHLDRLASKNGELNEKIDKLRASISSLTKNRNKADYIMAQKVVTELLDKNTMDTSMQEILNQTKDCGVR